MDFSETAFVFGTGYGISVEYAGSCGLFGYTTFNAVRYMEDIPVKDSTGRRNDAPDLMYILYRYLIIFNDFRHELVLVEMLAPGETFSRLSCRDALSSAMRVTTSSCTGP